MPVSIRIYLSSWTNEALCSKHLDTAVGLTPAHACQMDQETASRVLWGAHEVMRTPRPDWNPNISNWISFDLDTEGAQNK